VKKTGSELHPLWSVATSVFGHFGLFLKVRYDQGPKCLNHFGTRDRSVHHMIVLVFPKPGSFCKTGFYRTRTHVHVSYTVLVRLSSVCNVRSCTLVRRLKFSALFYTIWYAGHLLTSRYNFTEIVPGKPLCRGS